MKSAVLDAALPLWVQLCSLASSLLSQKRGNSRRAVMISSSRSRPSYIICMPSFCRISKLQIGSSLSQQASWGEGSKEVSA